MNEASPDPLISDEMFHSFFSGAYSMSMVHFHRVNLPWTLYPASNLTQISFHDLSHLMNYNQLCQILTSSPRLMVLSWNGPFPNLEAHESYPPIGLPLLERFSALSMDPSPNDVSFFHLLSTPVLTSLKIAEAKDLNAFISGINTTPPKYDLVTSLALNNVSLPLENTDIFSAFPKVLDFDVMGSVTFSLFGRWSHRVVHPNKSVVWPDLHTLSIDRRSSSAIALTRIIKFRHKYGRPLRTLRMTEGCRKRYSARVLQWLSEQVTIEIIPPAFSLLGGVLEEQDVDHEEEVDSEAGLGILPPQFDPYEEMYDPNDPFPDDAHYLIPNEVEDEVDNA
jgi:hypothetical protein